MDGPTSRTSSGQLYKEKQLYLGNTHFHLDGLFPRIVWRADGIPRSGIGNKDGSDPWGRGMKIGWMYFGRSASAFQSSVNNSFTCYLHVDIVLATRSNRLEVAWSVGATGTILFSVCLGTAEPCAS